MQVRRIGVAAVADRADHLSGGQWVAGLDLDGAGLDVGVQGVIPVAEVLDDVIACVLVEFQPCRRPSGYLLRQTVDRCYHWPVADREDVGAEVRVALHLAPYRR